MEIDRLITHYKTNYSRKIFLNKLLGEMQHAYIMYVYDYDSELENFKKTFWHYLPFYVRNTDYFETLDENSDIDSQLLERSIRMRKNSKIIPHRKIEADGIYGELFLDFYLRIVNSRASLITYANKRSYASNQESTGPDNLVYYIDNNGEMNICICEAKFVGGATNAKTSIIEDIVGDQAQSNNVSKKPAHVSEPYLNQYISFVVEKGCDVKEPDKSKFKTFFDDLNKQLDIGNDFVSIMIEHNICINFIFFAIFDSKQRDPEKLKTHYEEIYNKCEQNVNIIGFKNYKIEIVFIPTEKSSMEIKSAIEELYE